MARKQLRESSPGVKIGGTIGPALNPIGMAQTGPGTKYLDPTVAAANYQSPWDLFWADKGKVQRFSTPVKPRI